MELQELKNKIRTTIGWSNFGALVTDGYVDWSDLTEDQEAAIKELDDDSDDDSDDADVFKFLTGIEFKAVDQLGEAHDGALIKHIFSLDGNLYCVDYYYSSWDCAEIDAEDFYPVKAYQKTITAYKKV